MNTKKTSNIKRLASTRKTKLLPDYHPETIDELIWNPYYCDDCDTWHSNWVGLEIESGEILDVNCDTDGNWEHDGTGEKATEDAYERLNGQLLADTDKAQKAYFEHCAETGDDPLHEFFVDRTIKRKEKWEVQFTSWLGLAKHGFAVVNASRGKTSYAPDGLPEHVADYLHLHKIGDRFCMEGITSTDDMVNADNLTPSSFSFTVEKEIPRSDRIVSKEIKSWAKNALRRFK